MMVWKLYKPGQGYWTRMLSGVAGGMLVASGIAWLVNKLTLLDEKYAVYVQAGTAVAVIAVFGLLVFRLVGTQPRSCDFLIATEGEMKKVNWPAQKEVRGSTWVVIWCVFLLTLLLFFADFVFTWLFQLIGILEK